MQLQPESNIILCGAPVNYMALPISTHQSNAMVPINGKPAIGWILDDLLQKQITHVTVVLRQQDSRLQSLLERVYSRRLTITLAMLPQRGNIVESLATGLACSPTAGLVRIILGDTLIRDTYQAADSFLYVAPVNDSRRWCLVVTDAQQRAIDYIDKCEQVSEAYPAIAGYYHLQQGEVLRQSVASTLAAGEQELSHVLRRYGSADPLQVRWVQEWYDFGHIDRLVEARRRLLKPRFFNSLQINPVLNTITKTSQHKQKFQEELDWYLQIPDELKVLTPRIISHQQVNGVLEVVQEYYGYPTLAELFTYGDLPADTWASILRQVMRILQEFQRFPGQLPKRAIAQIYLDKTWQRLTMLCQQEPQWQALLNLETINWNGNPLHSLNTLKPALVRRGQLLSQTAKVFVIHGDFCFSNILFDLNNQIIRIIDPRGSFGKPGIYGDVRYDIAKLRHSICGLYDYLLADMFDLQAQISQGEFQSEVFTDSTVKAVQADFDQCILQKGYDLEEIRLIEGLLFISMLPLHHGQFQRQQMLFLTGLQRLNQALCFS